MYTWYRAEQDKHIQTYFLNVLSDFFSQLYIIDISKFDR